MLRTKVEARKLIEGKSRYPNLIGDPFVREYIDTLGQTQENWVTNLWRYMIESGITLDLCELIDIQMTRKNDSLMMDWMEKYVQQRSYGW
mgnify:CR=1 FL=1